MKIRHRIPSTAHGLTSDPVSAEYQAEVDRSTLRLEREYARAAKRLADARRRADRVQQRGSVKPAQRANALEIVAQREAELLQLVLLMQVGPSAQHRGRGSYRPIPIGKRLP